MTTPSQTVGPYFAIGLPWADGPDVVPEGTTARSGCAAASSTASGEPIPDALIETWQADPTGRYDDAGLPRLRARARRTRRGEYAIRTVKPGAVGDQAPHIDVAVFARGLLDRVVTRIYFPTRTRRDAATRCCAGSTRRRGRR